MDLNIMGWLAAGMVYIFYGVVILRKEWAVRKINPNETEIRFISLRRRILWAIFWPVVLAVELVIVAVGLIVVAILWVHSLIAGLWERRKKKKYADCPFFENGRVINLGPSQYGVVSDQYLMKRED